MSSLMSEALRDRFCTMQRRCFPVVLAIYLFCLCSAKAEIYSEIKVGDRTIECVHSGLTSSFKDCGARSDWYAYVFIGSISAITPIDNDEKQLQIIPEEIFYGTPANPLTIRTSQGECLPKLIVGDRWLFFLRSENGKPIVLDYYGNDSLPVASAREQIETLRHLRTIGDHGIVRGQVVRDIDLFFERDAIPNALVHARRVSDNKNFLAKTDAKGCYEFPLLPTGKYKLTVDPIGELKPDEDQINVKRGTCWDITLGQRHRVKIGGHVKRSNGSPMPDIEVVLIRSDNSWYTTTRTDKKGHYIFDIHNHGEFVVGLNFPVSPDWFNGGGAGAGVKIPPASTFYPGVSNRSDARVIALATDEKRDNINFTIPKQ
jgi:hypothetical protein